MVVRARVDRALVQGGPPLPVRITLVPVRGYQDQAERAARLLAAVPGVMAAPPAELDLAAPAGPPPPGLPVVRLGQVAREGLAHLLLGLLDAIEANVPGTVEDIDTEFLHDLRVAVRRTRSALKLAGDALPEGLADRYAGEFKWLGDLTTPVRDLDVFLLGFDALAGELAEADPADLEPLRGYLHRQRAAERRRLVRGLRSSRFAELTASWRRDLAALVPNDDGGTAEELGAARAARAWRRVARRGAATDAASPPEDLHDLRKRCKELRYVLELFAGVWDPRVYRDLVKELKVLQDCLGEFQDAEVHRDKVRVYAAAMLAGNLADAPTLLAMGELVARLGGRQRRAGGESVARVGRFVTDRNRRRVHDLVRAE
jgi:CHAD domain-containing protein